MKVKVIAEKWGRYKAGDELDMPASTAKAIASHGLVELIESKEGTEVTPPKKKGKK